MSHRFDIHDTPLEGLRIIHRKPMGDDRGYFERMFCVEEFQVLIPNKNILQINHTLTTKQGTVRGLHFQYPPHAEIKFVSCLRGEVFDVVVDLRRSSPTFLHWNAEILSEDNHKTFMIPEGFAHGFQTLTERCEMLYLHTALYQQEFEGGLNVNDPGLAIQWPQAIAEISQRDLVRPMLSSDFQGIVI